VKTEPVIQNVNVEAIVPNRFQPRLTFDEQALAELTTSIKEHGIIQPLVLRRLNDDKFEIIAGERRYKAATMAGFTQVPAVIAELSDNESAEIALVENIQRKDLTSIEEAKSYKKILDKGYITQEKLAERIGLSQPTIANKLRLLNLANEVQEALMNGQISERHARSLLALQNEEDQKQMLNRVINERLTVRQLDSELKTMNGGQTETLESLETLEVFEETQSQVSPNQIAPIEIEVLEPLQIEAPVESFETMETLETLDVTETNSPVEELSIEPEPQITFTPPEQQDIAPIEEIQIETLDLSAPLTTEEQPNKIFSLFNPDNIYPSLEDEAVNLNDLAANFNPVVHEEAPVVEIVEPEPQLPPAPEPEVIKRIQEGDITSVTNSFTELEHEIRAAGFTISTEEFDFEDLYQIIIKVDKTSS